MKPGCGHAARERLADFAAGPGPNDPGRGFRVLLLAAHPDDETIGASAILGRWRDTSVAYLTDGAPRDRGLWSMGGTGSRAQYAKLRRREAESALQLAGVAADRIQYLGAVDQESVLQLAALREVLSALLRRHQPDILITHAYEGGHPDHDSAALLAAAASNGLRGQGRATPELLEMTSYHARNGRCCNSEFLPQSASQPGSPGDLVIQLSPEEAARKAGMMNCYQSQQRILEAFPIGPERLRIAPDYDFGRPPHSGSLWYECMGWPTTGERWRALAGQAFAPTPADRSEPEAIRRAHALDRA
jgi:N-acetylglucosamine malate deacetylase 2